MSEKRHNQNRLQEILEELKYLVPGQNHNRNVLRGIFKELNRLSGPNEMPRRIELCRQALAITSRETEPELWGRIQDELASSLAETRLGPRAENLEQAIYHFQQALKVRSRRVDRERWAMTQNNLGNAYRDRICGERAKNLERAILHYRQALKIRTREADSEGWAMTQFNLAGAYCRRIRGERTENLERAIHHAHQALEVFTRRAFSHAWAQTKNTLGEAYRVRICGSRRKNIERAIYHFNQALEVHTQPGAFPEDWAMLQNNLAAAHLDRIVGERAENIEQAIHYSKQALEVRTRLADPERWAMSQYNLGNAYRNRIHGDPTENIEQAICHFHQALKEHTRHTFPKDWAQARNNLGNAHLARIRGKRATSIERAIRHFQQALEVRTPQALPEECAETHNNLGNAYSARIQGKRVENIELAVQHYQTALSMRTRQSAPADWAQTLNNLAGAERRRAAEDIELAIEHLQQVLEVYTPQALPMDWAQTQNNLAVVYADRKKGERAENIDKAILHYQQALKVYTRDAFPDHCLKTARALGNLAFEERRWELARDAYSTAFDAQDVLMQASFSRAGKQVELGEVQNLPPRAAYALVQLGDAERAVEVLERGRAQLLRESLERQRQDLKELPELGFKQLYEAYVDAMQQYNSLQSRGTSQNIRPEDWISQMDQALKKVHATVTAIREEVGPHHQEYRYFLQALPYDEIQKQARDSTLVYLSATSAGGLALIVTKSDVQAIELPKLTQVSLLKQVWSPSDEEVERINDHIKQQDITTEDIQAVSGGYFSMYALWSLLGNIPRELEVKLFYAWQETLDQTTRWLWEVVMSKLIPLLKKYSQSTILIPAGHLALLPLHAAWTKDESRLTGRLYTLDELNITYAPSAHALWQASLAAARSTDRLLAVDNPEAYHPKRSLRFAEEEVQAVLSGFDNTRIRHLHGRDATLEVVKEAMQQAEVLHFATHGHAGWEKAEQAQLRLADGSLTLPDIFALDLNRARLAVLSACETGVPGLELIDEMIGLPAGMMQAGVPGVVGSLWSVSDMSTAMLMARFYGLWREEGMSPQEALCQAQIWLRDSTTTQKKELFKHFQGRITTRMSAESAAAFYQHVGWDDPEARVFQSPYFWAAFTYTGV